MRRAVGVAFHGDRRHGDHGAFGEALFKVVLLRFTLSER
jgi:hypothetical protein